MNNQHVTKKEKLSYSLGELGSNLFWQSFNMFLLYFYTDIYGISAAAVGTIFLISRTWDVFADGAVGIVSDRTKTRWGSFRPYILWFAVPFSIMGVLTFTTPDFGNTGKIVYALVTYSLMMMLYSLVMIPYNSLVGVMTPSLKERNSVSSLKFVFAFTGGIIVQACTLRFVDYFGKGDRQHGYMITMAIFSAITMILLMNAFIHTKERVKPINQINSAVKTDLKDLFSNPPWIAIVISNLLVSVHFAIKSGTLLYYFKYYLNNESLAAAFMVTGTVASVIGAFLIPHVLKWIDKKHAFLLLMVSAGIFSALAYFPRPDDIAAIFIIYALGSLCLSAVFPIFWAMWADIADYSEWKNGRRATGLVFSASGMGGKFGWSIGSAFLGWILTAIGFHANIVQSPDTLKGMVLLFTIVPAVATVLAGLPMFWYTLTDSKMKDITRELEERKSNSNV
jgi:glycoside/pentoside/hexuronide:cation symporter, GPH family